MKSFKRVICALLAIICIGAFASCNDGEQPEAQETKDKTDNSQASTSYYFEYNNIKVELGAKADAIIEGLGQYKDKKEIGDCGGLGAQVKYSYASFEVYVLESKTNGNIIDGITFRDDIVSTPEGVCIGMSVSDAKSKLGKPTSETDTVLEYLDGTKLLKFETANGAVTGIDYMTVTE